MVKEKLLLLAATASMSLSSVAFAGTAEQLEGVWKMAGYGKIIEIKKGNVSTYHHTKISCVKGDSYYQIDDLNRIDFTEEGKMSFYGGGGITRYDMVKIKSLPKNCTDKINKDPEFNFEVFWNSYNDQYTFFKLHNVDWDGAYKKYRKKVTQKTTDKQLFEIFGEMIKSLNDGHVRLTNGTDRIGSGEAGTLETYLKKEGVNDSEDGTKKIKEFIAKKYLKKSKRSAVGDGYFTWGWVADDIGYFSIDTMSGYLPWDASIRETRALINNTVSRILRDLKGAKGIIIDARWNGGGYDEYALEIAGNFTDELLLAFTKRARLGDGFTPVQRIFIPNSSQNVFSGPVVYLQGRDTFSAAEIFTMAMQAIPNVTSMGEKTGGALSDVLGVKLPNGWETTMSNELYIASTGKLYEGLGIPADIKLPKYKKDGYKEYLSRGIDRAVKYLQKK